MSKVWDRRHFEYGEVDILAPENKQWKSLYELEIPVVRRHLPGNMTVADLEQVHVDRTAMLATRNGDTTAAARKLKHRFTEAELEKVMDEVEKS